MPARSAELVWTAPDGCSSDAFVLELEAAVEQRLAAIPSPNLIVAVTRTDGGREEGSPGQWQVVLALDGSLDASKAQRVLTGDSCRDVSRAAAAAVATALHDRAASERSTTLRDDTMSGDGTVTEQPRSAVGAAPIATGDKTSRGANDSEPSRADDVEQTPRAWRVPLHAFVGVDSALQGIPSLGFGAGGALAFERWSFGVRGQYLPPVTLGDDVAIALHTWLGMGDVCLDVSDANVRPRFCMGYEVGQVSGRGTGTGLAVGREQVALWQAVKPEVALFVKLDAKLYFQFSLAGAVALNDAVFVFDEGNVAHDLPRISVRGQAGFGWQL